MLKLQKQTKAFQEVIAEHKHREEQKHTEVTLGQTIYRSRPVDEIAKQYDSVNGGFATRPKFPEASKLELLLDLYALGGHKKAL